MSWVSARCPGRNSGCGRHHASPTPHRLRSSRRRGASHRRPRSGDRDPEGVLRDVIEEKVTREHAQHEYGVVLVESEGDGAWTLDLPATENLREQMLTAAAD